MQILVVDDNDNVIGTKERKQIDYKNDIYRITAVWVTNSKGQVLIAKRGTSLSTNPGKWATAAAGTVDKGETYEINAYKELEEEIGLSGVKLKKSIKTREYSPQNYFCQWYTVTVNKDTNDFTLQKDEVDEIKWVSINELKNDVILNQNNYVPDMLKTINEFGL